MNHSIFIGYEPREAEGYAVTRYTLNKHAPGVPIGSIRLDNMRAVGLYKRPTSTKNGRLWDDISDAPMSTEFAISRFLTPHLSDTKWALFMDCDMLCRRSVADLFELADDSKAVMCVKHNHRPPEGVKMDGQLQTLYARKNWSSVMLFNCEHPANQGLTVDLINSVPGRDLHRFCWLQDDEIGELPPEWNYLVGHSDIKTEPALVHFTEGLPNMPGYENSAFASEWHHALKAVQARGLVQYFTASVVA